MKKINYRHYICITITILSLLCSIFIFPSAFGRLTESFRDLGTSFAYYVCEIFIIPNNISPTVMSLPQNPFFSWLPQSPLLSFPESFEAFKETWILFWKTWIDSENFNNYLLFAIDLLNIISQILIFILPFILIFSLISKRYLERQNNHYNKNSKALNRILSFGTIVYLPCKKWTIEFITFIKNSYHGKIWLFIWLFNFNIYTIIIEFIAFYFYFIISFNITEIFTQLYKLLYDLWIPFQTIPLVAWIIVAYIPFNRLRRNIGYSRLEHFERKNRGFINEQPLVIMACGTMGKGKTTMLTDMCLSTEVEFRQKAFELILETDLKFPNFPWINFENSIKKEITEHKIYNLATCRVFVNRMKKWFQLSQEKKASKRAIYKHLKKNKDCAYRNLLFNYNFKRYGYTYDDGLQTYDIWEILEDYVQLYFIYTIQSSLIVSNYSIRSDMIISDVGNFPLWDSDFFKRDSKLLDSFSRHAHILDFDSLRLGKMVIENNKNSHAIEFGVIAVSELGKERRNMIENKYKNRNASEANQMNDGFTDGLKMKRHDATVCNYPFIKIISDEQRPESLGADARDLFNIIQIDEKLNTNLAMPFYNIEELFHTFTAGRFFKKYSQYRYMRADNTAFMYLQKNIFAKINHRHIKIYNTFSYHKLKITLEKGTLEGVKEEKKYYLLHKKIYAKRFATDCFADYFKEKALQSSLGINDIDEYEDIRATWEELKKQNSYFINQLLKEYST